MHFFNSAEKGPVFHRYHWPVSWISSPNVVSPPYVLGFRLFVQLPERTLLKAIVTADERYELFLDGKLVSRGSERGSPDEWYYETLNLEIEPGRHSLFARTWALGQYAPVAQFSVRPGLLFAVQQADGTADPQWCTGLAPWEVKELEGYTWIYHPVASFPNYTGGQLILDGNRYPWGAESGRGENWSKATVNSAASTAHPTDLTPLRLLVPGTLPQMLSRPCNVGRVRFAEDLLAIEETAERPLDAARHLPIFADQVQSLLKGTEPLIVPRHKKFRVIIDLQNYYCAYPRIVASGGKNASLSVGWAEALFEKLPTEAPDGLKGNRHDVDGRRFLGIADKFIFDGQTERSYSTLWWKAGRYLELIVETQEQELTLNSFMLEETRYPLEREASFATSDSRYEALSPILLRTLQMNAHETFMDCPYYEQLNYTGDTLIDCLIVYTNSHDLRLVRKSLQLFNSSRLSQGLTQSRFPCRLRQFIPPFSLLWISMVRNHALWRGERDFIRTLLLGVRAVLDAHLGTLNPDGLLPGLRGWNFLDWVPAWDGGIPPGGDAGQVSGPFNWLLVCALAAAVELETFAGEKELAARYSRLASNIATAIEKVFWNERRGLYADDVEHQSFSEHSQCLALLSNHIQKDRSARTMQGLVIDPGLHRCTIYFAHYLFETFQKLGLAEPFFQRMDYWLNLPSQGFVTVPEKPEPSRSDCHAWGSHPLYHFYSTILGVRPSSMNFASVTITPLMGPLKKISGRMPHPLGWIEIELERQGSGIRGTITLPPGISGQFIWGEVSQSRLPGGQRVLIDYTDR